MKSIFNLTKPSLFNDMINDFEKLHNKLKKMIENSSIFYSMTIQEEFKDEGTHYVITIPLKNFKKGNITASVENRVLNITAQKDKLYYSQSVYLWDSMEDEIKAKFEDGILTITIPKRKRSKDYKEITIE